jgi:hypothetical protein
MKTQEPTINHLLVVSFSLLLFAFVTPLFAQESPIPEDQEKMLSEKYKGKSYSPYAKRDFPNELLWGDSHLHTGMSFDAGTAGCILLPEDAYRFAKGDEVESSS